jgi:hypothetical protein
MQRSWIVIAAVAVAIAVAIALLARRGGTPSDPIAGAGNAFDSRVYQSDSLGLRMRIPDTPGWTLERVGANADGRLAIANHDSKMASVELVALPATPETTVDGVLEARQKQLALAFGVKNVDQAIARVMHDEHREVGGRSIRQWQAVSNPIEVPGEPPARAAFMWVVTATPSKSIECLGLVRFPAQADAASQERSDALLRDVAYILQSFEVR